MSDEEHDALTEENWDDDDLYDDDNLYDDYEGYDLDEQLELEDCPYEDGDY